MKKIHDHVFFTFGNATAGWVQLVVMASPGQQHTVIYFSDVFNPFPQLKKFLGRVQRGKLPTYIKINEERTEKTILVQPSKVGRGNVELYVLKHYYEDEDEDNADELADALLHCTVKRSDFVSSLDRGVARWLEDGYDSNQFGGGFGDEPECDMHKLWASRLSNLQKRKLNPFVPRVMKFSAKIIKFLNASKSEPKKIIDSALKKAPFGFENPRPGSFNYFEFKDLKFICNKCGWYGLGAELKIGEIFSDLEELDCPSCHAYVACVGFPTLQENIDNWDKVADEDKLVHKVIVQKQDVFERACLKSPDQLPEIQEQKFALVWDDEDGQTVIKHGDRVIFCEPHIWEGYERFEEVARILKEKYKDSLSGLNPTSGSELCLYGDKIGWRDRMQKFQESFFQNS